MTGVRASKAEKDPVPAGPAKEKIWNFQVHVPAVILRPGSTYQSSISLLFLVIVSTIEWQVGCYAE